MTLDGARRQIVLASLVSAGSIFTFFLLGPAFGFPLEFQQAIKLVQLSLPVFLGYLGAAAHFMFSPPERPDLTLNTPSLMALMVRGPLIVFAAGAISALVGFAWTNRASAPPGIGMSLDNLMTVVSLLLGFLAVTTSVVSAYLFAVERRSTNQKSDPSRLGSRKPKSKSD